VKLLFDENLSYKLVGILAHDFPDCAHVRDIGLRAAEDRQIWDHARAQGLVIVSKDTDFRERSYVEGFPP
jgi:predicted nuclease of predicted toxin-antitoxin system